MISYGVINPIFVEPVDHDVISLLFVKAVFQDIDHVRQAAHLQRIDDFLGAINDLSFFLLGKDLAGLQSRAYSGYLRSQRRFNV